MRRLPKNTIKLPKQLLDELAERDEPNRSHVVPKSRTAGKERRKAERGRKKERSQLQSTTSQAIENYEFKGVKGPKIARLEIGKSSNVQAKQPKSILKPTGQVRNHSPRQHENGSLSPPSPIPRGLRDRLAEDDAEIAALERKLRIGGKKLPKAFVQDGLDILLDGLGKDDETAAIRRKRKRSDEDGWLESIRKNAKAAKGSSSAWEAEEDTSSLEVGDDGGMDVLEDDEKNAESSRSSQGPPDGTDHLKDFDSYSSDSSRSLMVNTWGNPYVVSVTSPDALASVKYVPPSLRRPSTSEAETFFRLRRQVQGLLNRLTEANLLSILGEVECLYRDNPRQHVTSILVELLSSIVCDRASLTDTFLVLHAGFIAGVYRVVGTDFGASVVQRIVEEFDHYHSRRDKDNVLVATEVSGAGKITANLMSLLAELYNFQVIGSNLVFDYIRVFLAGVSELNTELLLKTIKISGQQLRQDDPSTLKDIVLMLQPFMTTVGEANLSVRTKFMIETLNELKNNRLKTGITASAVRTQHTVQMRKRLGSLNVRTVRASGPLRLGLKDIRDTDGKGKWWLVGTSWKNGTEGFHDPVPLKQIQCQDRAEVEYKGSTDLIQLAREQRMNTGIRRAIFITIMCASDYMDAHQRLLKLRLKRAQELEIPSVLIHCAGAEQVYNPYYTLMAKRLCREHRLKMAFQFSLWDLFKRMGEGGNERHHGANTEMNEEAEDQELGMRKLINLAKMFGNLIVEGPLGLGVLKTLNLVYLQTKTRTFVELMLITIFLQSQRNSDSGRDERAIVDVFMQVKGVPQMTKSLTYFLRKVVSRTDVAGGKIEKDIVRWGCKVAGDTLRAIEMSKVTEE